MIPDFDGEGVAQWRDQIKTSEIVAIQKRRSNVQIPEEATRMRVDQIVEHAGHSS